VHARRRRALPPSPPRSEEAQMNADRSKVLWQGLVAGVIGHALVATLMAVTNVLAGRSPFHTAALLGSAWFYGLESPDELVIWAGPVLAYNGLHLILFLALGVVAAWLARLADRGPHLWYVGLVLGMFAAFHVLGLVLALPPALRGTMLDGTALAAGFVATLGMAAYLVWAHPKLRAEVRDFAANDPDLADQVR
jgi:hypothetical protein